METHSPKTGFFPALAVAAALCWSPALALAALKTPAVLESGPAVAALPAGSSGAAIQQALDALPAAGGEIDLAAGVFPIGQPIVLQRDHQTLRGVGVATILRLADNANCPVIVMGEPVNEPHRTVEHLLVSGLTIDGNRLHQQSELWLQTPDGSEIRNNGITVQDVSDSAVKFVSCAHCRSGGLVTTLGVRHLTVQNLESFDNRFDGLACYLTTDSRFTNLNLHDNPGAGISLDLSFDHNDVSNAVLTANDLGIFMRASNNNRFQNITVRRSHHFGVFIAQADIATPHGWQPLAHSQCTDNLFTGFSAVNCGGAAFHVNDTACTNNVVSNSKVGVALHDALPLAAAKTF